ncbi:hypothetical protein I4U23_023360 [Adineta vaga]|nr:hypothetical protein I4U23_023360 [Adineta vaga]
MWLQSLYKSIYAHLKTWNAFNSRSSDPSVTRRELLSTRLYLLLLIISVTTLATYTSFTQRHKTESVTYPTYSVYQHLYKEYFDSLQCSCTKMSIPYEKFTKTVPSFHQVCSSDFVSQPWIDFIFAADLTLLWSIDVRTSLSAMWQLIRAFCQSTYQITMDILNEFNSTRLSNPMLMSEEFLKAKVYGTLLSLREKTTVNFIQSITITNRFIQLNQLVTALGTNYINVVYQLRTSYDNGSFVISSLETQINNGSCPLNGSFYLYNLTEQFGTFYMYSLPPKKDLPGVIVNCLPLEMTLASTFEFETITERILNPNEKEYEILQEKYSSTLTCPCTQISFPYEDFIKIQMKFHQICSSTFIQRWWYQSFGYRTNYYIRTGFYSFASSYFQTLSSFCDLANQTTAYEIKRFLSTTFTNAYVLSNDSFNAQITSLINSFIQQLKTEFVYRASLSKTLLYSNQYVSNFDVITTHTPVVSTDSTGSYSVRMTVYPIYAIHDNKTKCYCVLDSTCSLDDRMVDRGVEFTLSWKVEGIHGGCSVLDSVLKSSMLAWFKDNWAIQLKSVLTEAGISIDSIPTGFTLTSSDLYSSTILIGEIFNKIMIDEWNITSSYENYYQQCHPSFFLVNPSESDYTKLIRLYSQSVQCPCNNISVKYKHFMTIETTFHQICSSEFVTTAWRDYLFLDKYWYDYARADIRSRGSAYFIFLSTLCRLSQTTVNNAIDQFLNETFINTEITSKSEFRLQIDSIFLQFQEVTTRKFSRSLNVLRDIMNDSLLFYATTVPNRYPYKINISAMNSSKASRFKQDTFIQIIANELFVEEWKFNRYYSSFYTACAPLYCSYTIRKEDYYMYTASRILGLYGGLTIVLRLTVSLIVKIIFKIRNQCQRNEVTPYS